MARNAILLPAALILLSIGLSSAKPLDEEILIEKYFRALRQADWDTSFADVKEEEEVDPGVNETFWMDSDDVDQDNETPAISLSFVDMGDLQPSINGDLAKALGKKASAEEALQKTAREGKIFGENHSSPGGVDSEFENKIPFQWTNAKGLFKQLKSS